MSVTLAVSLLSLASALILSAIVDKVIGEARWNWLAPLIIVCMMLPWICGLLQLIGDYLVALISQKLVYDIRTDLYHRVHLLSYRFMQNTTTGKLMERLRGDVQQVQMVLSQQTLSLVLQLATALVAVTIMFWISTWITLVVLMCIGLYVVNYRYFVRRIRSVQRRYRRKMDQLSGRAQERLAGTIVVKAYHRQRRESRDFAKANFLTERVYQRFRMLNMWYGLSSSAIAWSCYMFVLLLGTYFVIRGDITYGGVMALGAYTWRLLQPAVQLAELSNQIEQTKVSLDRIFELMAAQPDAAVLGGKRLPSLRGEVAFENVCFQYDPGKPVLRHVNLYVKPGQTVALVGHTGCGKSTIINLLYRFYEPQAGHLTIDGHDISTLNTRWYRQHLALVPQEPIVFDTTLAENIAYGRPGATRQAIERAARMVELGELIDTLPKGLDTPLGEYGAKLSVGERQRLCIARAVLAEPVILVLDEATSSLDPPGEAAIQRAMQRVMEGRTAFIIAHRLSTIVNADTIVVMDQGRVIEMGNHSQLMARHHGHYRHLFTTQMALTAEAVSA
ncbi:MAG: ABC transporter ATP-binding protein [Phycisphaeraceae bacterium]|nr:ABC transporter ATP-binding protein [Phycisphaeraceae bacterium]